MGYIGLGCVMLLITVLSQRVSAQRMKVKGGDLSGAWPELRKEPEL